MFLYSKAYIFTMLCYRPFGGVPRFLRGKFEMMTSVACSVFEVSEFGKKDSLEVHLDHPFVVSLSRFKQKVLYNTNYLDSPQGVPGYFITLTISEKDYPEITQKIAFSAFLRKYSNRCRNFFKRHGYSFNYIKRIERGSRYTQRLHLHQIIYTDAPADLVHDYFQGSWVWCDWEKILKDTKMKNWFQKLDSSNLSNIYITKYMSKSKSKKSFVGLIKTRSELACRITSTSRIFKKKPAHLFMVYNKKTQTWNSHTNEGYFSIPPAEYECEGFLGQCWITEKHFRPIFLKYYKNMEYQDIKTQFADKLTELGHPDEISWHDKLLLIARKFPQKTLLTFGRKKKSTDSTIKVQRKLYFYDMTVVESKHPVKQIYKWESIRKIKNNIDYYADAYFRFYPNPGDLRYIYLRKLVF